MKRAFTLLELIIVVIILGVLASLAISKFMGSIERTKATEGVAILGALREAQIRYHSLNGEWATSIDQLDISVTDRKYFEHIFVEDPDGFGVVARVNRTQNATTLYLLGITEDGEVRCTDFGGDHCSQFEYPPLFEW